MTSPPIDAALTNALNEARRLEAVTRSMAASRGRPEQAFGDLTVRIADSDRGGEPAGCAVEATMQGSGLRLGPDGEPLAGSIGVLVDDGLGFAIIAAGTTHLWSVSVEISIDFLRPLSSASTVQLHAVGGPGNDLSGYAHGVVATDIGEPVAHVRQHGRYVPAPASFPTATGLDQRALPETVAELLGSRVRPVEDGVSIELDDARQWLNALGVLHGGIAICAVDEAATQATLDSGIAMRTTSITAAFARPMVGDQPLSFRAHTLHAGRTVRVLDVVGFSGDRPCTFARVTRQAR